MVKYKNPNGKMQECRWLNTRMPIVKYKDGNGKIQGYKC